MYRARASRSQSGSAQKTCVPSGRATMKIASLSAGRAAAAIASGPGFPIGVEGRPTRTFVSTDSDRTVGGRRVSPCESIGRARRVTERRASREPVCKTAGIAPFVLDEARVWTSDAECERVGESPCRAASSSTSAETTSRYATSAPNTRLARARGSGSRSGRRTLQWARRFGLCANALSKASRVASSRVARPSAHRWSIVVSGARRRRRHSCMTTRPDATTSSCAIGRIMSERVFAGTRPSFQNHATPK